MLRTKRSQRTRSTQTPCLTPTVCSRASSCAGAALVAPHVRVVDPHVRLLVANARVRDPRAATTTMFDGITYGKGAAVLKQLVAVMTMDKFKAGMQLYFQR